MTIEVAGRSKLRLEGLAPGEWEARLHETRGGVAFVVGRFDFRIESEATASVGIAAPAKLEIPELPVRGHVTVGRAWWPRDGDDSRRARLECVLLDESLGATAWPAPVEAPLVETDTPDRYSFDFGTRWPGEYRLVVVHSSASAPVAVAAGQAARQELVIPDPAEVELTLRLAGSTRPLDRARVEWVSGVGEAVEWSKRRHLDAGVAADPSTGRYRFVVPAGRVSVTALPPVDHHPRDFIQHYPISVKTFDLRPGRNELTWELASLCSARLLLRDGFQEVACPRNVRVAVEREGAKVECKWHVVWSGALVLQVEKPGRHFVTISSIPGYCDPLPMELEFSAGGIREAVVPLEPTSQERREL